MFKPLVKLHTDFVDKIVVEIHENKIGVKTGQSPKCYSELAGDVINYYWANFISKKSQFHQRGKSHISFVSERLNWFLNDTAINKVLCVPIVITKLSMICKEDRIKKIIYHADNV